MPELIDQIIEALEQQIEEIELRTDLGFSRTVRDAQAASVLSELCAALRRMADPSCSQEGKNLLGRSCG